MLRKTVLTLLAMVLITVVGSRTVDAASLIKIEESTNIINKNKGLYYVSAPDVMRLDIYGTSVKSGNIQYYHDAGLTQKGTYKEFYANTNGWFKHVQFSCVGWYTAEMYNLKGDLVAKVTLQINEGDLQISRCDSIYDEPNEDEIQENLCNSLICECIDELRSSTDEVKNSVEKSIKELEQLNRTTSEIKTVLIDFANEFKTDINYSVTPMPDVSNLLDQNKPEQIETPFYDNNTYFEDKGDAPAPGKLPLAPDIKDWDGFKQQSPLPPEKQLNKTPEKNKSPESKKDNEMKKDSFRLDPVKNISPVKELQKFEQTDIYDETQKYNQTLFFNQTNIFESGGSD